MISKHAPKHSFGGGEESVSLMYQWPIAAIDEQIWRPLTPIFSQMNEETDESITIIDGEGGRTHMS